MTTYAERKGLQIGRTYMLETNDYNSTKAVGMLVKFTMDDGSMIPYFQIQEGPTGANYEVGEIACIDLNDVLTLQQEPLDNPREILDTKAILKKYISTKYSADTFLDFLVENV